MPSRSPIGLTFLPHYSTSARSRTTRRRCENAFSMRAARPRARGVNRFITSALPTVASATIQAVDVELVVVLGVGDRRLQRLAHVLRDPLPRELQLRQRPLAPLAADQLRHQVQLARADAQIARHRHRLVFAEPPLETPVCPWLTPSSPSCRRSGRGRSGSARTRRTCGPTMFSVTSTGTNFLPLWTPKVRPTNCGMIVERRDHVRITSLRLAIRAPAPPSSADSRRRTDPSIPTAARPLSSYFCRWRRRMISASVRLLLRVRLPLVGLPHGVTGCRPPEVLPSPPPCG